MKHQVRTAVTALALVSGASLAVSCGAPYNGVKGTVVEAEHEVCGVELSMDNVAFDLQNTKGGTSGSKGSSTGTKPKTPDTSGTSGGTAAGVGTGTAVAAGAVGAPSTKPSAALTSTTTPAKKPKGKKCKEKWELEIKDSSGTVHEVKVDRRVYSACGINFKFPSCAD